MAFLFLTVAMLWKHKRLLLVFLGTMAVALICAFIYLLVRDPIDIGHLAGQWQFWTLICIFFGTLALALWFQFSPAIVRFNDIRRELANRGAPS
jgi:hypothetical protein